MGKSRTSELPALASSWSPPPTSPAGEPGRPLISIASTYTFHASLFETDLLPRFLGLKFDDTESVRPFVVEREQALATARVCILVDADHVDPSQTTLRWDQFPVRVPGGSQHSKVVLLLWEHYARLVVSSANLTRTGYRRNRELASAIDFFDHADSAPRRLILDAIDFLRDVAAWVRASDNAIARLRQALEDTSDRVRRWRQMPADFSPREVPRVSFVGGLPRPNGRVARSPLEQLISLWGARRASEISVMTPFVGNLESDVDPVVEKLLEIPHTQEATGHLVVPGQPSEQDAGRMVIGLPRRFLEAWASAWHVSPDEVPTYVVPLCRAGEKANRDLHAKAIVVGGDHTTMLLCGSSNFSPHGMGVKVSNIEANLCFVDETETKRGGIYLYERLPINWDDDKCLAAIWPAMAPPPEEERAGAGLAIPDVFLWAAYNQRTALITVAVDPAKPFPPEWSIRWPGEGTQVVGSLINSTQITGLPPGGRLTVQLPQAMAGANIAALRLLWCDTDGQRQSGLLPVHTESTDDLLPPEEFRSLTATRIIECLLSGRELADLVDSMENQQQSLGERATVGLDPLGAVDTSAYLVYRTRRLGAALAVLGTRLWSTVRSRDAIAYRLRQDPFGPRMLAEALVREWTESPLNGPSTPGDPSFLVFGLAELTLMLAHVAQRIEIPELQSLFSETIEEVDRLGTTAISDTEIAPNMQAYVGAVRQRRGELIRRRDEGRGHAG